MTETLILKGFMILLLQIHKKAYFFEFVEGLLKSNTVHVILIIFV